MEEATNLVVALVPEADDALAASNGLLPPDKRLTAPAHITFVYPFLPSGAVEAARAEMESLLRRPEPRIDQVEPRVVRTRGPYPQADVPDGRPGRAGRRAAPGPLGAELELGVTDPEIRVIKSALGHIETEVRWLPERCARRAVEPPLDPREPAGVFFPLAFPGVDHAVQRRGGNEPVADLGGPR